MAYTPITPESLAEKKFFDAIFFPGSDANTIKKELANAIPKIKAGGNIRNILSNSYTLSHLDDKTIGFFSRYVKLMGTKNSPEVIVDNFFKSLNENAEINNKSDNQDENKKLETGLPYLYKEFLDKNGGTVEAAQRIYGVGFDKKLKELGLYEWFKKNPKERQIIDYARSRPQELNGAVLSEKLGAATTVPVANTTPPATNTSSKASGAGAGSAGGTSGGGISGGTSGGTSGGGASGTSTTPQEAINFVPGNDTSFEEYQSGISKVIDVYQNIEDRKKAYEKNMNVIQQNLEDEKEQLNAEEYAILKPLYDELIAKNEATKVQVLDSLSKSKDALDAILGRNSSAEAVRMGNVLRARGVDMANPMALAAVAASVEQQYITKQIENEKAYNESLQETLVLFNDKNRELQESLSIVEKNNILNKINTAVARATANTNEATQSMLAEDPLNVFRTTEATSQASYAKEKYISSQEFSKMSESERITALQNLMASFPDIDVNTTTLDRIAQAARTSTTLSEAVQKMIGTLSLNATTSKELIKKTSPVDINLGSREVLSQEQRNVTPAETAAAPFSLTQREDGKIDFTLSDGRSINNLTEQAANKLTASLNKKYGTNYKIEDLLSQGASSVFKSESRDIQSGSLGKEKKQYKEDTTKSEGAINALTKNNAGGEAAVISGTSGGKPVFIAEVNGQKYEFSTQAAADAFKEKYNAKTKILVEQRQSEQRAKESKQSAAESVSNEKDFNGVSHIQYAPSGMAGYKTVTGTTADGATIGITYDSKGNKVASSLSAPASKMETAEFSGTSGSSKPTSTTSALGSPMQGFKNIYKQGNKFIVLLPSGRQFETTDLKKAIALEKTI